MNIAYEWVHEPTTGIYSRHMMCSAGKMLALIRPLSFPLRNLPSNGGSLCHYYFSVSFEWCTNFSGYCVTEEDGKNKVDKYLTENKFLTVSSRMICML